MHAVCAAIVTDATYSQSEDEYATEQYLASSVTRTGLLQCSVPQFPYL